MLVLSPTLNLPPPRRRIAVWLLAATALLLSPARVDAGSSFKVGSFTKSTTVAPPDTTQTVDHGLGETPKAIIFWVSPDTGGAFTTNYLFAWGMTDGSISMSAAVASQDGVVGSSNAGRRMAPKAITVVRWDEVLLAEADLTSWNATNFTLTWTTNDAVAYRIHFIAIGGSDVSAKVVSWQAPTSVGLKSVTDVGFRPDVVIHAYSGSAFEATPPASQDGGHFGIGVMDGDGTQWANMVNSKDAVTPSDTQRGQDLASCIYMFGNTLGMLKQASFDAMLDNGFRVNFTTTDASASQIFSLALKGVKAQAGNFFGSTAVGSQSVTNVGFRPSMVLLSSDQYFAPFSPAASARLGIGASDGATEGSTALQDTDLLGTTSVDQIDSTDKVFTIVDNDTQTLNAAADLTSRDDDGFTLNWTTNTGTGPFLTYLALAPRERGLVKGHFTKSTSVATQKVAHHLGEIPKALILWTVGQAANTEAIELHQAFGMTDGTTSMSASAASRHDQANSNASRRQAAKVLTIVEWSEGLVAEADLVSWDEHSFTLDWTANTAGTAYDVHFIAIGESAAAEAKVVTWNGGIFAGLTSVPVGFEPDVVLHVNSGYGFFSPSLPATQTGAALGLGVMNVDGAQWATAFWTVDQSGLMDTQRGQRTDSAVYAINATPSTNFRATFSSMDPIGSPSNATGGFTVDFVEVSSGTTSLHFSLALQGLYIQPGSFNKHIVTDPASQSVSTGFEPGLVMLASFENLTGGSPVAHSALSLGAADGTAEGATSIRDDDGPTRSNVYAADRRDKIFKKQQIGGVGGVAEADLTSLDADGFTLNWTTNDWVASEILYLAFLPVSLTEVRLTAFDATQYDRGVLVEWRTAYEIDNLGFHVYREVNGERVRVTASLIAGSGLMAGQGTSVNAEQRYAVWDTNGAAVDPSAVYWLEDRDFNGTSTWHGPIAPVAGGLQAPPDAPPSTAVRDLSKAGKRRGKTFNDRGARLERPRKVDRTGPPDAQMAALETQWGLAAQAAVKIGIDRPGWYRVTQADLVVAGLNPGVDPRTLRLFVDGIEQSFTVTGAADGRFDPADGVEFYGTGLDTPSTATRTYWLVSGAQAGRRIPISGSAARGQIATSASNFAFTVQQKERSIYFAALRNGDAENWFGAFVSEEPTDLTLNVANLDVASGGAGELEVALQGVTTVADVAPDHQVGIFVNGAEVGEVHFDGQAIGLQRLAIPAGILIEGENTVTIVARGGEADYSLVDVVRLHYPHTYHADADLLRFTVEGGSTVSIKGFAGPAIRTVDITDPRNPEELRGTVGADGGLWGVTVRPSGDGVRTLLAFSDATVAAPAFLRPNAVSRWHAPSQRADYVAISPATFADPVAPLLARRERQGLSTALIDIEDIYDEFSFGEKSPQALRDFVARARAAWTMPPRFLLLVGDATIDPRDYAGFGEADFVPTKQLALTQVGLETASDDWFADLNDDGLPELAVGRFSVRTVAQADVMVAKTLAYEDADDADWMREVLLVADQNDEGADFEAATNALARLVPADYAVQRVVSGAVGADTARRQIQDAANRGQLIVNYIGHGSTRVWSRDALLTTEDVAGAWRNRARLPLVVAMNCLNGFFQGIYDEESLAETLLRAAEGGAVAAWASSGVTASGIQVRANQELFRLLFAHPEMTVGEAVVAAKRAVSDRDVRRSWIFFGDPALRLRGIHTATVHDVSSPLVVGAAVTVDRDSLGSSAADPEAANAETDNHVVRLADFTGDGRDDLLFYDAAQGAWMMEFSDTGETLGMVGRWKSGLQITAGRLNDDAAADLVFYDPRTGDWTETLNAGQGRFTVRASGTALRDQQLVLADVTGDGRDDRVMYDESTGSLSITTHDQTGDVSEPRRLWPAGTRIQTGDFNGDGFADLVGYDVLSGRGFLALRTKIDFAVIDAQWGAGWTVTAARLSDRRRSDLVFYDPQTGAARVASSDARGGLEYQTFVWPAGMSVQAADFEGDGRGGLFGYSSRSGLWWTAVFSARGVSESIGQWTGGSHAATGDLDGDGRTDVVLYDPLSGLGFRFHTVTPGVFDYRPETWPPGAAFIGRP